MFEVPIGGDQNIEAPGGQAQQFAIRFAAPAAATLWTSWPVSNAASGRGNDSSSRTRTGGQQLLRSELQYSYCLLAFHRRKVVEELFERIACRKVVDEVL